MLGRNYDDKIIQNLSKNWLFNIKPASDGSILVETSQGEKTPIEINSIIIRYLLDIAVEHSNNKNITHAVISVPANYNTRQRNETKEAAIKAGLEVVHLISEPTAGITSYWFSDFKKYEYIKGSKTILTFDFGGGTLDLSLSKVTANSIEIFAVAGKMDLGGRDIDKNIADYYIKEKKLSNLLSKIHCSSKEGEKARDYIRKINEACEKGKKRLSKNNSSFTINPDIVVDSYINNPDLDISKDQFNKINEYIISQIIDPVTDIIKDAAKKQNNFSKNDIDDVILIGGSCNNAFVKIKLCEYFERMPTKSNTPEAAVVKGAAIDAYRRYVNNKNVSVIETLNYQEICPLSLGVDSIGDQICVIIPKNSKIPVSIDCNRITVYNFQKIATFNIHETEKLLATDETKIGSLELPLPLKQVGDVTIKLKLSLDEDCILSACAWVINETNPCYKTEKIIREKVIHSESFIQKDIADASQNRNEHRNIITRQRLIKCWNALNDNVISFVQYCMPNVNSFLIKMSLMQIEIEANTAKMRSISNKFEYDCQVDKYIKLFEQYNNNAPPDQRTKFLKPYSFTI